MNKAKHSSMIKKLHTRSIGLSKDISSRLKRISLDDSTETAILLEVAVKALGVLQEAVIRLDQKEK